MKRRTTKERAGFVFAQGLEGVHSQLGKKRRQPGRHKHVPSIDKITIPWPKTYLVHLFEQLDGVQAPLLMKERRGKEAGKTSLRVALI